MNGLWIIVIIFAYIYFKDSLDLPLSEEFNELTNNVFTPQYIITIALAIQTQEGWYSGSRSYRNNNPGNLRWSGTNYPWKGVTGKDDTNHVIFDSFQSGWNALLQQLRIAFNNKSSVYNTAMSLYDFFRKYAEGNQASYARNVAASLGVTPETTLNDIKKMA